MAARAECRRRAAERAAEWRALLGLTPAQAKEAFLDRALALLTKLGGGPAPLDLLAEVVPKHGCGGQVGFAREAFRSDARFETVAVDARTGCRSRTEAVRVRGSGGGGGGPLHVDETVLAALRTEQRRAQIDKVHTDTKSGAATARAVTATTLSELETSLASTGGAAADAATRIAVPVATTSPPPPPPRARALKPCRFFASRGGCTNARCKYPHIDGIVAHASATAAVATATALTAAAPDSAEALRDAVAAYLATCRGRESPLSMVGQMVRRPAALRGTTYPVLLAPDARFELVAGVAGGRVRLLRSGSGDVGSAGDGDDVGGDVILNPEEME
jgi:hypothetical protein